MLSDVLHFDVAHHLGEPATRPLSGWRNRLATRMVFSACVEVETPLGGTRDAIRQASWRLVLAVFLA